VLNREYSTVVASPKNIKDPEGAARWVSKALGLPEQDLIRAFGRRSDEYEVLVPQATKEQAAAVRDLAISGISIGSGEARHYPYGTLAAHLLGFVGPSGNDDEVRGRYGVELFFEDELGGTRGRAEGKRFLPPADGTDLALTIDRSIEARAEEVIEELVAAYGASGGTVIVSEPRTGKILALANAPTFDPNKYQESAVGVFLNPALQSIYEPGSVFKVFTMAAGIDAGKITPQTKFTDTGSLTLDGRTIRNWDLKAHGTVTMTEVIEQSINTGAAFAERQTGHETFANYLKKFGLGEKTGIALPGELKGSLKNLTDLKRGVNFANASFGQGVAVTPIQLMQAVSAIANGGMLMEPILDARAKPRVIRRVISSETARAVTAMMTGAVKKAEVAQVPNYTIAGKTGTAQIPDFKQGGYTEEFIHSYVGFAPASNPRFAILLKLDKPNVALAGATVVPAFRELAEFILNYYAIPPDDLPVDAM
jgi:cell division protein FtsI/penicillin-binding protein 2